MSTPETILLAVTGMSPAVLTETVWALAAGDEPVVPDRVIVVTTAAGRERINGDLFSARADFGGRCAWDALREALAAAGHDTAGKLRFGTTADDIRVITAADPATGHSVELSDLRHGADNEAAADFLLDQLRGLTANPDTRLVASIAGGRKTMGALLYACMTLVGREDDRLTHVLVSDPYETLPGFFFPAQPGPPLRPRSGKGEFPPAAAVIELAEVPFVSFRNLFQRELGRAAGTFSNLVAACRSEVRHRAAEDLRLEIYRTRPVLKVNHREIRLTEREHHLALCLAERAKTGATPPRSYKEGLDATEEHARQWNERIASGTLPSGTPRATVIGSDEDLTRVVSDLRSKLKQAGPHGATLAAALPERGRFSLDIPGEMIAIL